MIDMLLTHTDHDFSTATPESFMSRDLKFMHHTVNSYLAELTASNATILEDIWHAIDEVITLRDCEIYSYVPDMNEDPFSDGTL